jgi:UDP-3-O-[3-hydroxymyristoyl] glucosamine N-acyltransferase
MSEILSVLRNASAGCITYYVGNNPDHVAHLKDCTLYCRNDFDVDLPGVTLLRFENPQLEFYRLSAQYKEDYLDSSRIRYNEKHRAYIHEQAVIEPSVRIGPGSVIGKVNIGEGTIIDSNVTIYSKTSIGAGCEIQSNTTIGAAGMMWIWHAGKKVFLEQLGSVVIEDDCRIGSQIEITRGSANEVTRIGTGTCLAHGCMLGHGCEVGPFTHMANGILLAGGVTLAGYNFIGSGVIISSGVTISAEDVVLGAGATIMKDIDTSGVYVGTPARRIKDTTDGLAGMPDWR